MALKRLAAAFGGSLPKFSLYQTLRAVFGGIVFIVTLIPRGKNSPQYLRISYFKGSFIKLKVYRESFLSEAGEKIGLIREAKTGDGAFDSEFLIFADKPERAAVIFYDSQAKESMRELFRMGYDRFTCDQKKIFISKPGYSIERDLEPEQFRRVLEKVDYLARRL